MTGGGVHLAHVGLIVHRLEAAASLYRRIGLPESPPEIFAQERIRLAFVEAGSVRLELMEPLDPAGPLARFLAGRGEGIHHLALEVPDLDQAMARARAAGARVIDESPRTGTHGTRVAFIHPGSGHGVLIELVERQGPDAVT